MSCRAGCGGSRRRLRALSDPDADLPPIAFHGLRWASIARAKDRSPPFDPMAARVTPRFTQTTRRLRKGRRDSSAPAFNVAQIRRDLPAIAFHAAGSVSIQKANGALGAAVSRHYLLFCRLINPFIAAHKLRRRGAGGDAVRGVVGLAIVVDAAAGGALVLAVFVVGRFLLPRDSGIKRSSNGYHRLRQGSAPALQSSRLHALRPVFPPVRQLRRGVAGDLKAGTDPWHGG